MVSRRDASEQRAGQHQQTHADQAASQMRHFQHRERQEAVEDRQPRFHTRGGAGEQHDCSGEKRQRAGDLRHDRGNVDRRQLVRAREAQPVSRQLLDSEQHGAEQQRHQIVNGAIRQQRAQQGIARHVGERQQDYRLEHPDAAGDVTDDPGYHRGSVGPEEGDQADVRPGRQDGPQHCAGQPKIDDGQHDLRESDHRPWRTQRPAPDLQVGLGERAPRGVRENGRQ